jgi:hypothetical protein
MEFVPYIVVAHRRKAGVSVQPIPQETESKLGSLRAAPLCQ